MQHNCFCVSCHFCSMQHHKIYLQGQRRHVCSKPADVCGKSWFRKVRKSFVPKMVSLVPSWQCFRKNKAIPWKCSSENPRTTGSKSKPWPWSSVRHHGTSHFANLCCRSWRIATFVGEPRSVVRQSCLFVFLASCRKHEAPPKRASNSCEDDSPFYASAASGVVPAERSRSHQRGIKTLQGAQIRRMQVQMIHICTLGVCRWQVHHPNAMEINWVFPAIKDPMIT